MEVPKNILLALSLAFCVVCVVLAVTPASQTNMPTPKFDDPNRGWSGEVVYDFLVTEENRCDFDVVYEVPNGFTEKYPVRPTIYRKVVYPPPERNPYVAKTTRSKMLELLKDENVILSNAITHSHGKKTVTFPEYLNEVMDPPPLQEALDADARETWYQFGDNYWDIVYEYARPEVFGRNHTEGALSFGIGRTGSGVPFHVHGPVIAEVMHGRKRWFMAPWEKKPDFDPIISSFTWYHDIATNKNHQLDEGVLTCIAEPGDLVFVPNEWWHSTLNIGETVFMAMFLEGLNSPQDNDLVPDKDFSPDEDSYLTDDEFMLESESL